MEIFYALIGRLPEENRSAINENLDSFIKDHPKNQPIIFPEIVLLRLTEYEILNFRNGVYDQIPAEEELNILKSLLVFNENYNNEFVEIIKKAENIPSSNNINAFHKIVWPKLIGEFEFTYIKDFSSQIYLAVEFLEYLGRDSIFKEYLRDYLKKSDSGDFKTYLKDLIGLFVHSYKMGKGEFHSRFAPDLLERNTSLNEFVIEPTTLDVQEYEAQDKHKNFVGLREKPFIRFEDGYFTLTSWNFAVDKLFQSFLFDFYHNSGIDKNHSFNWFKSEVGLEFAQKKVFENILYKIFSKSGGVHFKEDSINQNFDYYYRLENKVIFFEFKDVLLNYNSEFIDIKTDIDRKMIQVEHKGTIKKKAVLQLIDQIVKFQDDFKKFDDFEKEGIDKSRIIIYPVIVYTHKSWGISGINDYLKNCFSDVIRAQKFDFFMIRELVMIDFDVFLNCFDAFSNNEINLIRLLEKYVAELQYRRAAAHRFGNSSVAQQKQYLTFEEVTSSITNKSCGFVKGSLYNEMAKKLEIPGV
ncbi:MAG: hypothetical protein H8D45_15250 [Bacteroidetes bacterium]|nr:hypothetical protein [Bacteroidota bacterium]